MPHGVSLCDETPAATARGADSTPTPPRANLRAIPPFGRAQPLPPAPQSAERSMFPTGGDRAGGTARRTPQKEGGSASKETKPPLYPVTGLLFRAVGVGDQNTTAVFADDDLLALTDIGLALRRNPIEAAAARIAFDGHYG